MGGECGRRGEGGRWGGGARIKTRGGREEERGTDCWNKTRRRRDGGDPPVAVRYRGLTCVKRSNTLKRYFSFFSHHSNY